MKDMSINQKKWAEGISKRNLVRLYFSFRQLHVPRETKIEPDRRLHNQVPLSLFLAKRLLVLDKGVIVISDRCKVLL